MKTFNRILLFVLATSLFTACSPKATPTPVVSQGDNPYAPQAGDNALMRGEITIDSASLNIGASQPLQVALNFAYFQPTPCYQLRVEVNQPDAQNRIEVSAYAVAEKDKACTLMALATPLQASLNLGSFPQGQYSVLLNGKQVGDFAS
jgi:hypothetical protein